MSKIAKSLTELIGFTPLVELSSYKSLPASLIAKLEYFNPGGSVKDRVALAMVEDAEKRGVLKRGGTLIIPTSGNTGIGLALVATIKRYKALIVMPDSMSEERIRLLKAYGAQLVLTPGAEGMTGSIHRANSLSKELPNSLVLQQFENWSNPEIHFRTTGEEIWNDTDGRVDIFVAGVGTGGTVSGVGKALKKRNSSIQVIAVEPASSPVLLGGSSGKHGLQGIGAGFIPEIYQPEFVDEVIAIEDGEAKEVARTLAKNEGILVGISSGAACAAAIKVASRPENSGKRVVVLFPDGGERYLSTGLF